MRILLLLLMAFATSAAALPGVSVNDPHVFVHDGEERTYFLHVPDGIRPGAPLVVVLHGLGGRAEKLRYGTEMNALADAHGFAVVYPQGLDYKPTSSHWNAGFDFSDVDDLGFLTALVAQLDTRHQLSPAKSFAVGISNGGYMAYHMACHAPEVFAGIAVIAGTMAGGDWGDCDPREPTAVLHIHGTEDPMIRWEGARHWMSGGQSTPPVREIVEFWRTRHGTELRINERRGPYELERYSVAGRDAVWFVGLKGFGHDLPNKNNAGFSAVALAWEFFASLQDQRRTRITARGK